MKPYGINKKNYLGSIIPDFIAAAGKGNLRTDPKKPSGASKKLLKLVAAVGMLQLLQLPKI